MGSPLHSLGSATLSTLIGAAQAVPADDSREMNEIVRRFEPLTRRLARGMTASRRDLYDDVANACRVALVRAVRRHDLGRAGFPAYAERYMRGAGLRELAEWRRDDDKNMGGVSLDDREAPLAPDFAGAVADELAPWGDGVVAAVVRDLSPAQQTIVTLRYVYDAPLEAISGASGTSVSAVSQRLRTIHRVIEVTVAA